MIKQMNEYINVLRTKVSLIEKEDAYLGGLEVTTA